MTPVRASALLCGAIFGLGLVISQMALPAKVLGFLDVAGLWDPSMLFVLGAAVLVTSVAFPVIRRRRTPLCDTAFEGVPAERVDARLLAGAAVFGVGWELAGYCPGPGIVSLARLAPSAYVFVGAFLLGSLGFRWMTARSTARTSEPT